MLRPMTLDFTPHTWAPCLFCKLSLEACAGQGCISHLRVYKFRRGRASPLYLVCISAEPMHLKRMELAPKNDQHATHAPVSLLKVPFFSPYYTRQSVHYDSGPSFIHLHLIRAIKLKTLQWPLDWELILLLS